jgi:hypothetical protein
VPPRPDVQQQPHPADRFKIDTDRADYAGVEDDAPVRSEDQNRQEFAAYNDTLLHARKFTVADQERYANRDVTFPDLLAAVRTDYRFQLVYFEGRLKRLRRLEPTKPLKAEGVTDLYEGWMFPANGADPLCVLTTELPPGLDPAVEYDPARPVAVAGYFFKVMRYEAPDPKDPTGRITRRAPLLMARSFTPLPAADADASGPWRTGFLPGVLAVVGGVAAVTLGLTWWFRTGDRPVRRELADRRDRNPFADDRTI